MPQLGPESGSCREAASVQSRLESCGGGQLRRVSHKGRQLSAGESKGYLGELRRDVSNRGLHAQLNSPSGHLRVELGMRAGTGRADLLFAGLALGRSSIEHRAERLFVVLRRGI